MKHSYLSTESIQEALANKAITASEAARLNEKINCQASIYKAITK